MLYDFAHEIDAYHHSPCATVEKLHPACPSCEHPHLNSMYNGDYSCPLCSEHIDAFTWKRKTEELVE